MRAKRAVSDVRLARFLQERLEPRRDAVPFLWRASNRPIHRLELALDPPAALDPGVDALFLHRPFKLPAAAFPGRAILAAHRAFDDHLTLGSNPRLAEALGLRGLVPLDPGSPWLGFLGGVAPAWSPGEAEARLKEEFGGWEESLGAAEGEVSRVAIANAMTPATLAQAAALGASLYLTGQLRMPAIEPARRLEIRVIALGHARIETWGLRQLARELQAAFPGLETRLPGDGGAPGA